MTCAEFLAAISLAAANEIYFDIFLLVITLIVTFRTWRWARSCEGDDNEREFFTWVAFGCLFCMSLLFAGFLANDIHLIDHPADAGKTVYYCADQPPTLVKTIE
jgi:hypothetical protein